MGKEYWAKVGIASNIVRRYLLWTCGVLFFYAVMPAISYAIFWGLIPTVSLTAVLSLLLFPTVLFRLLLLLTKQLNFPSKEFALTLFLLLWTSILQLVWYPVVSSELSSEQVFSTFAFTIVATWVAFLGGEALAYLLVQRPRLVQMGILGAYASLALVVMDGVIRGFKYYGKFLFAFRNPISNHIYNYLALSDSLAIVGLFLLSTQRKGGLWRRAGLYFLTILLLLFAYSRASLLTFFITGLVIVYIWFQMQPKQWFIKFLITSMLIGMILTALVGFFSLDKNILDRAYVTLARVSNLFSGEDLSLQTRIVLLQRGFALLKEHWLLGRFMIEAVETGWGTYVHNWLSFWLAYGIGPFLLSIWVILSLFVKIWRIRKRSTIGMAAFGILSYCLLAIVSARSYIWPFIWLALGFTGSLYTLIARKERTVS